MKLFRTLFAFDALGFLVVLFFFIDGLRYTYGAPSLYWVLMLAVPAGVLGWSWSVMKQGRTGLAKVLLGLLAVPFAFALFFVGLFIFFPPNFQ